MEDHASLEQRKAKARLLSASTSSISVASHYNGSTSFLNATDSRIHLAGSTGGSRNQTDNNSSDSLSDELMCSSANGGNNLGLSIIARSRSNTSVSAAGGGRDEEGSTPRIRKKKEVVYHIRGSDDLSLKTIKFVKSGAGEGLVAL